MDVLFSSSRCEHFIMIVFTYSITIFPKENSYLIKFLLQSGKDNLRTVSRRQVIKSTIDLIEKSPPRSFSEFTKSANEIKKLMDEFNDKMALLQAEGYDEK